MTQTLSTIAIPIAPRGTVELTFAATLRAGYCAQRIAEGFLQYDTVFRAVTRRAPDRFHVHDWQGSQLDAAERSELYGKFVDSTLADIKTSFGDSLSRPLFWREVKRHFASLTDSTDDIDLCRTFFNAIGRRLFKSTNGKSDSEHGVEFTADDAMPVRGQNTDPNTSQNMGPNMGMRRFTRQATQQGTQQLILQVLQAVPLETEWQDVAVSTTQMLEQINTKIGHGTAVAMDSIELLDTVFYRFTRAYAIGRITAGGWAVPFVLELANTDSGAVIESVMLSKVELVNLFRLSADCFHAELDQTTATVTYLHKLMRQVAPDEILTALGRPSVARERVNIS